MGEAVDHGWLTTSESALLPNFLSCSSSKSLIPSAAVTVALKPSDPITLRELDARCGRHAMASRRAESYGRNSTRGGSGFPTMELQEKTTEE